MEDLELRGVVEDLNARQLASTLALKAILLKLPDAAVIVSRMVDSNEILEGVDLDDSERDIIRTQLRSLLPRPLRGT